MNQHNLLLIGLGGTGCAMVRELKKKLYIEWRTRRNTGSYPEVYEFEDKFGGEQVISKIATLSVDSNAKDLEGQGERSRSWRVFGETLRLRDKEKVLIDPSGIERILSSVERYPGIEPWIRDDIDFVRDIARGSTEPAGCNQIRRMGRLATANGNSIENIISRIADRLKELSSNGQVGAEIHIACTLAAGTGSGSVIDVITQLQRHLKSQPGSFEIFIHGFVTAKDVGDANTGNFYANQYAALTELNALRLGIYEPWDICARAKSKRLSVPQPGTSSGDLAGTYRSVALITDTTEGGTDVPLDQQIENAAEFIFQMAVRQMGDVPKSLRDALTMEDRSQYPSDVNGGTRSTAFISYGVQRAAIPEREILEKLSYSFAKQFILKLLYNKWDECFRDTPHNFSKDGFVGERRGLWRVTKEHLYLDLVEDTLGEPEFKTYEAEWRDALMRQEARVKELGDSFDIRKGWLTDFDRRVEKFANEGFRSRGESGGISDYFKIRRDPVEIRTRARNMRAFIEKDLLSGMERMEQEYALVHLPVAIEFLAQRIEDNRLEFSKLAPKAVEHIKEAGRQCEEIHEQFQKGGRWAKGKHERLFGSYREATTRKYYWQTIQRAAEYGQEFSVALIDELNKLQQQVTLFCTRTKLIVNNLNKEIETRISENEAIKAREDVIYLVDAKYVNKTIHDRFECNKSAQELHATNTIELLKTLRGERIEFGAYLEKMPVDDAERVSGPFVDELRKISEENAVDTHIQIRESDKQFDGILGQNIVRKLYNDFGGRVDGELEQWLRQLMDRSMPMISFDPNEEPMDLPSQGPVLRRCIFVPRCQGQAVPDEFEHQLEQTATSISGGQGSCKQVDTFYKAVPEERNPCEIVVISVAFFFPARHTRVVHGLKTKYLERLNQKTEQEARRAYFDVHTESHHPRLPDLMKQERRDVLEERFPPILVATAMDLMQIPEEDGQQILFGIMDSFGRVKDKIASGMTMSRKIREAAAESHERFTKEIPLEMVALYSLYLDQFREESLGDIMKLIQKHLQDGAVDLEMVQARLDAMGGQVFLLSGKKEDDETYQLFDAKLKEASALVQRLADRSSL